MPVLAPKIDCCGGWPAGVVDALPPKLKPVVEAGVVDPKNGFVVGV